MNRFASVGLQVPNVLLPRPDIDPQKWAVVACDQYTSELAYWEMVEKLVGDAPSTLRLIYPEVHLGEAEPEKRIAQVQSHMKRYVDEGVLQPKTGFVYVARTTQGRTRHGLVVALDLECYDYNKTSTSLVRATEGTILSRLPPRIKVREGAPIELPHIMVLIDDPKDTVIGPLKTKALPALYDFELMQEGGHLRGGLVDQEGDLQQVHDALSALAAPTHFAQKYSLQDSVAPLLYAMGDGNHSLATAKAIWESLKEGKARAEWENDPRRFALVELVNVHDEALVFEPIHRVLFEVKTDVTQALQEAFKERLTLRKVDELQALTDEVERSTSQVQRFGMINAEGYWLAELSAADANLPVGSLQAVLDPIVKAGQVAEIDYVHGTDVVDSLGRKDGNVGFYLPSMDKHDLFKTVIVDGALPRKTFSMGEAHEKRFYMECRSLSD